MCEGFYIFANKSYDTGTGIRRFGTDTGRFPNRYRFGTFVSTGTDTGFKKIAPTTIQELGASRSSESRGLRLGLHVGVRQSLAHSDFSKPDRSGFLHPLTFDGVLKSP